MTVKTSKSLLLFLCLFLTTLFLYANKSVEYVTINSKEFKYDKIEKFGISFNDLGLNHLEGGKRKRLQLNSRIVFDDSPKNTNESNDDLISSLQNTVDDVEGLKDHIDNVFETIRNNQAYLTAINGKDIALPFAIPSFTIGGKQIDIAIDSIIIRPNLVYAVAYCIIENTKNDDPESRRLYFRASGIELNEDGAFSFGGNSDEGGMLYLVEDYKLMLGKSSIKFKTKTDGHLGTYVKFGCEGFEMLVVNATATLLPCTLFRVEDGDNATALSQQPANSTTQQQTTETSDEQCENTFSFDIDDLHLTSLDEFYFKVSDVGKFRYKDLDGFVFNVKGDIILDLSSVGGGELMTRFPEDYPLPEADLLDTWEGFYMQGLEVTLPDVLARKNSNGDVINENYTNTDATQTGEVAIPDPPASNNKNRIVGVSDFIVDRQGVSGLFYAYNLIVFDDENNSDAKMGKWQFSLDKIQVKLLTGTLVGAGIGGQIQIPIADEEELFRYDVLIQPDVGYNFVLELEENMSFPLWGAANVEIYQDSYLEVKLDENGKNFKPKARISGEMGITASLNKKSDTANDSEDSGSSVTLASVKFIGVIITGEPKISLDPANGAFSVGSSLNTQKLAKLPITISEIGIESKNCGDEALTGIVLTINVNLVGEKDSGGGFSGSCTLAVWGKFNLNKYSYKFHEARVRRIELNEIKIAIITLSGYIEFYRDDPVYGSGFTGGLKLAIDLSKKCKISVEATCIFGKKTNDDGSIGIYRYWAVDAMATFPAIGIVAPMVYMNALGGGASYAMMPTTKQDIIKRYEEAGSGNIPTDADGYPIAAEPVEQNTCTVTGVPANPVKYASPSGVAYIPSDEMGLGIRAMLGIQGKKESIYKGELHLEVNFQKSGGLHSIIFSGFVTAVAPKQLMSVADKIKKIKEKAQTVTAKFDIKELANKLKENITEQDAEKLPADLPKPSADEQAEAKKEIAAVTEEQNKTNPGGKESSGALLIKWHMMFNRPEETFAAQIYVFANIADVITGSGPGNQAGYVDMLFSPSEWHVYIGTPSNACGLQLEVGPLKVLFTTYLEMGTVIEPPLPIDGVDDGGIFSKDVEPGSTKGFAFGARFVLKAGRDGSFYWHVELGAGFDVLIENVEGKVCKHNGKSFGINNWFMIGQLFVYFKGDVGVKTSFNLPYPCCWKIWKSKCWCKKRVNLDMGVEIKLSRVLYVKAPNPTWVLYNLKILAWEIPIEFGKECVYN